MHASLLPGVTALHIKAGGRRRPRSASGAHHRRRSAVPVPAGQPDWVPHQPHCHLFCACLSCALVHLAERFLLLS